MYKLSDKDIEFILNDIKQRGVELEDLQLNLLDHVCCIVEAKMKEGDDFRNFYNENIKRFYKEELWEIEEETVLLLKDKHVYKKRILLYALLFLSLSINIFYISGSAYAYFKMKKAVAEMHVDDSVTLQQGFSQFTEKFREQFPESELKQNICVYFKSVWPPMEVDEDSFHSNMDSARIAEQEKFNKRGLMRFDSLAFVYNNKATFVVAYQNSGSWIDKKIEPLRSLSKNCFILTGLNELYSGHRNQLKKNFLFPPSHFILNKQGQIVLEGDMNPIGDDIKHLSNFLRKLP